MNACSIQYSVMFIRGNGVTRRTQKVADIGRDTVVIFNCRIFFKLQKKTTTRIEYSTAQNSESRISSNSPHSSSSPGGERPDLSM